MFPLSFFFFNDTATTEIYTLSLHDALPIFLRGSCCRSPPKLFASNFSGGMSRIRRASAGPPREMCAVSASAMACSIGEAVLTHFLDTSSLDADQGAVVQSVKCVSLPPLRAAGAVA